MSIFDNLRSWFESPPAPEQKPKVHEPVDMKPQQQMDESVLQKLLASGNFPAKSSVLRECSFGADFTFMLSGDFIEFNSHSEMDPSYQYEPDNNDEFTGYKPDHPVIAFGPCDELYDAVDAYLENGERCGKDFREVNDGNFLFCTKLNYYDQLLYAYAFANETTWDHQMLGLMYPPALEGTPLEQKLLAALDEAARTYREVGVN